MDIARLDLHAVLAEGQDFARTLRVGRGHAIVGGVPIRDS
jgi:hypothetical protein